MTPRPAPRAQQVHMGRWMWAAEIPWLPDLLAAPAGVTVTGDPLREAFGRQIAFLRALAAGAPAGSALQLRFTAEPADGRIACHLLGAGDAQDDAELLGRVVATALPPELPLDPLDGRPGLLEVLRAVEPDGLRAADVVEIRRAVDRLDPTLDALDRDDPVLLPWTWSAQAMLASLGLLRQQAARTVLVVHLEPATFPASLAGFLQDELHRLVDDVRDGEEQPMSIAIVKAYRRWLRLLPKGCLSLRVLVAGASALVPGLAESLSTDLTRSFEWGGDPAAGAAEVLAPRTEAELDACATLLDELRATPWRTPAQRELAELQHLFDPLEANTAFRFPIAPRGGLPGVASQRPSSVDRGFERRAADDARTEIGATPAGGRFGLSARDVNQHVLVAGLPGFGKTSTVQLLLRRLHAEQGIPFLVIDPAKGDYAPLLAELAADGADVAVHRLGPDAVAFNPLAVPEGVDPATHAGRLVAAFDAALDLSGVFPLAFVQLNRVVTRLYDRVRSGAPHPTMRDLYRETGDLIRRSSFSHEVRGNLEGSLLGRLELLATGPCGRTLAGGPNDRIPWGELLARPTLVELGRFAAPTERSLMFALLIAGLVSYREAHPLDGRLGHVTVLEEAHRVLRPTGSRDAGVDVFVDAIAELRGAGEGFVVVDQTPTLLHPAVLKLTGTKLAHRLVDAQERAAVGASMVLDAAQREDLARLGQQRMIAYAASASTAALVDVDRLERDEATPSVPVRSGLVETPQLAVLHCVGCPAMCQGSAGAAHAAALADAVDLATAPPSAVLTAAVRLTQAPAEAYCLAATATGIAHHADPAVLAARLAALQGAYHGAQRARQAQRAAVRS